MGIGRRLFTKPSVCVSKFQCSSQCPSLRISSKRNSVDLSEKLEEGRATSPIACGWAQEAEPMLVSVYVRKDI